MWFKITQALAALMLVSSAVAVEIIVEGQTLVEFAEIQCQNSHHGLKPICPHLNKTADRGCIRYVRGFDVTGVVTEVDLKFPQINDECDCIQECLNRPTTCASWVWKFSTADSVMSGHRTCTLYSQFNLPAEVIIEIDLANTNNSNLNAEEIMTNGNNPQMGATVGHTFMDVNLNSTVDKDAVSGAVWQLSTGMAIC